VRMLLFMHQRCGSLSVTQPFDLALSIEFLRGFSPMTGEQRLATGSIVKSWLHRGQPIEATLTASARGVDYALASPRPIDRAAEFAIADTATRFLSADEDLAPFYAIAERDDAFAPVARRLRGLHHVRFGTPFEAACWSVINQRIGRAQARAMKAALVRRFGAPNSDAFPEPAAMAHADERELFALLGHQRKARALAAVTAAFAAVEPSWLHAAPLGDVERWLRAIWGVGDFAAAFVLFRGLGRAIALPWGPKFVTAAQATYGARCDRAALERRAGAWGPWLGHWSLYLYAAAM
jgi:DNA-3-methyladenine glycosylase II